MAASLPFWTGKLYAADTRLRSVPSYWTEAATWLDRQPGDDRVLVLPGSTRTAYRWGWTGDDILDALIRRPHVVDTAIPLSTPEAANLVTAMVMWTAFASVFSLLLGYSRVPYAAALDGNYFASFARLHPQHRFPYVSLLWMGSGAIAFCFLRLADLLN